MNISLCKILLFSFFLASQNNALLNNWYLVLEIISQCKHSIICSCFVKCYSRSSLSLTVIYSTRQAHLLRRLSFHKSKEVCNLPIFRLVIKTNVTDIPNTIPFIPTVLLDRRRAIQFRQHNCHTNTFIDASISLIR